MGPWLALLCGLLLGRPALAADATRAPFVVSASSESFEANVRARAEEEPKETARALLRFYEKRGFLPAWFADDGAPRPEVGQYLAALHEAGAEGLWPERYHCSALEASLRRLTLGGGAEDAWREVELGLTSSFLTYASHLLAGQVSSQLNWRMEPPGPRVLAAVLEGALLSGDVAGTLRGLSPGQEGFVRLREALGRYRAIAAAGGWPLVPEGAPLKRGMRNARVAVLRERLRVTGDLPPTPGERLLRPEAPGVSVVVLADELVHAALEVPSPEEPPPEDLYDAGLAEAVKTFQRRHGLEVDGKVGSETLAALRVPVGERIGQLLVNLERWRWAPRSLESRYVLVNLPAFELEAVDQGRTVLRMPVIIGMPEPEWSTPIVEDEVKYLVLHPEWNVPEGITEEEVLPKLREDAGAAEALGLKVLDKATGQEVDPWSVDWNGLEPGVLPYRFSQAPGESNPLGQVKFMFPNRFAVYLHDTPNPALFAQRERALSHGCVRVAEPAELADFMLRGHQGWTKDWLEAELKVTGEQLWVQLPAPVPVHLLYWTAFVDAEGRVEFRRDIYQYDAEVLRALSGSPVPGGSRG